MPNIPVNITRKKTISWIPYFLALIKGYNNFQVFDMMSHALLTIEPMYCDESSGISEKSGKVIQLFPRVPLL